MTARTVLVIYLTATDGDIAVERVLVPEFETWRKRRNLPPEEMCVIDGVILKGFDDKDMSKVK